jgi:hypothetical protein
MKNLYRALRPGGIALITESFECVGEEYPSHLPENFRYAGKTHSMMEGLGFANTYNHLDPINCPMEFIKAQPNHFGGLQRVARPYGARSDHAIASRQTKVIPGAVGLNC